MSTGPIASEVGRPSERECADLERRYTARAQHAGHSLRRAPYHLYIGQSIEIPLCEAQVLDRSCQLAIFDQEGAVARHTGDNDLEWVNWTRVVEARDPDAFSG